MLNMNKFFVFLTGILLLGLIGGFYLRLSAQEQITITTYYPSPEGSYRELTWGDLPSNSRGLLSSDQGSSIELGGLTAAGNPATPYIDFHNDMKNDFDLRIILEGDNSLMIRGQAGTPGLTRINTCTIVSYGSGVTQCPPCYFVSSFLGSNSINGQMVCCMVENPPAGSGC